MKADERDSGGARRRAMIERLPAYRWFTDYGQFKCPCCHCSNVIRFDHAARAEVLECRNGCSEAEMLAWVERQPAPRVPSTGQQDLVAEHPEPSRSQSDRRPRWPSTEYALAQIRARTEAEAIYAEELAGPEDAWAPSLLSLTEPEADPSILRLAGGPYLLRRGVVSLVSGLPGSAKTPVAYLGVVDAVQRGETAMIIDHEMGWKAAGTLLRDLGLTQGQIDTQVIHYDDPPPLTAKTRDKVIEACAGVDLSYVVIDALAGSMPSGASQNDAADIDAWFASTPKWFAKQFNAAVLVIDHSNKGDGPEPGGSVRKQGVPYLRMWLRADKGFSRSHEDGRSTLIVQRDRSGIYGRGEHVAELRNQVLNGGSRFVLRPPGSVAGAAAAPASTGDVTVDLTVLSPADQRRLDLLEKVRQTKAVGAAQKALIGDSGAQAVVGRKDLELLERNGLLRRGHDPGTSRGVRWWVVEFFPDGLDE